MLGLFNTKGDQHSPITSEANPNSVYVHHGGICVAQFGPRGCWVEAHGPAHSFERGRRAATEAEWRDWLGQVRSKFRHVVPASLRPVWVQRG